MAKNKSDNPWAMAEAKERRKKRIRAILIGLFAVIMALSMMLPSFSAIFAGASDSQQQTQQTDDNTETSDDSSDDSTEEEELSGMAALDKNYKEMIDPLEEKLKESPEDLPTLLNLGNYYMNWGYSGSSYVTNDDENAHVNDQYKKAIEYYDRYLKLNDSDAVKIDRALCTYYSGDQDGAVAAMEKLTKDSPDYAPAWANLGLIYEMQSKSDEAKKAYQTAVEKDADNEFGAKDYANQRLAAIGASENPDAMNTSVVDSSMSSSADGASALSDALGATL